MNCSTAFAPPPATVYSEWTDAKDEPGIQYRVRNAHGLHGGWYSGAISLERRMKPWPATQTTLSTDAQ